MSHFLLPKGLELDKITSMRMKGVYKLRPPTPIYKATQDVEFVLDYLRSFSNDNITLKLLSFKCMPLIALARGQRGPQT